VLAFSGRLNPSKTLQYFRSRHGSPGLSCGVALIELPRIGLRACLKGGVTHIVGSRLRPADSVALCVPMYYIRKHDDLLWRAVYWKRQDLVDKIWPAPTFVSSSMAETCNNAIQAHLHCSPGKGGATRPTYVLHTYQETRSTNTVWLTSPMASSSG